MSCNSIDLVIGAPSVRQCTTGCENPYIPTRRIEDLEQEHLCRGKPKEGYKIKIDRFQGMYNDTRVIGVFLAFIGIILYIKYKRNKN